MMLKALIYADPGAQRVRLLDDIPLIIRLLVVKEICVEYVVRKVCNNSNSKRNLVQDVVL